MVHHQETDQSHEVKSLSESTATTPAIVGICLGTTLFLVGIVAVTLFFYRRTSIVRRKSGVYLTPQSPLSESMPLQSQLVIHRRSDTSNLNNKMSRQHLVMMKKSPSPPMHYTSPKNLSPVTPPSEESAGSPLLGSAPRFCTTAEIHQKANRSSPLMSSAYGPPPAPPGVRSNQQQQEQLLQQQSNYQQQQKPPVPPPRLRDLSPRTSPTSPVCETLSQSSSNEVMNLRNGNTTTMMATITPAPTNNPAHTESSELLLSNETIRANLENSNATNTTATAATTQILTGGGANLLGILHFRIRYKTEKGALIVTVVKCEDLPVKDTTLMTCDPYVKLQLLPEKQQRVKTRVLRHTRQPIYEEDFTFYGIQPNQLEGITLHFVVLSFDRYSRDDVIGEVFCPLSTVQLPDTDNHQLEISRDIQPRNLKMRSQGRGEVLVSLCWQPTANRLTVVVLKARNLPKMDVTGLADPYVKIYLLYDGTRIAKKKTHIKKRTLNPVFNESFVFDLPPGAGQGNLDKISLQLLLLDWDRVTKNEVIGRLELGNGSTSGTATHHWTEVLNCPRRQIAEWHKLRD